MLDWLKATGCIFALFLGVFAVAAAAQAGPEDGRIVNGSGSISQSGTHTDIRQNSDFLATHWGSFNIAAHESVQAHQPDASSRLLIRVDGGGTGTGGGTNIAGSYTSNGITILENRNGVQFSRGAIVNVGGLLATSSRISGVSGANWQLNGTGGAVVNHGQIAAGAGGVVLAAVRVENHGKITAQGGDVALGAGSAFTVDFAGSLVGFEVKKAADGASVVHDGVIESQGGVVSLSAQEAQAVRTNVVSVGGVVKATRIERRGGVVYLSGGTQGIAEVSGDVSASRKVQTTGEYIVVKEGALLKAPKILVGGDFQGKGDVPTSRRTLVEAGALLDASAKGRVIVWSDETTWFNGDISAPGGFAEVSGKQTLASVNLAGIDVGELLLDPADIIIADMGTDVVGDITAGSTGAMTLAVASINSFAGALTLAASDTIMVNVAILKPMGDLTLEAGGVLTIAANIRTSAGNLTLQAATISLTADVELISSGNTSLTGAISGNQDLTLRANGDVILNSNINIGTTGTLAFAALVVRLGSDIVLTGGTVTLSVTDMVDGSAINADLTINSSTSASINNVNLGTGNFFLNNTGANDIILAGNPIWTARNITLTGAIDDSSNNRNLTIRASGVLTLNSNITLGTGNLNINAMGGITLGGPVTLTSRNIILRGAVDGTTGNRNFTVMATGAISLFNNITLGSGDLTLDNSAASNNTVDILIRNENNAPPVEIILSAGNITLAPRQTTTSSPLGMNSLSVRALENITIGGNRDLRNFAGLQLRADDNFDGTGTIMNGGTAINIFNQDLVPMNLLLQQAGPFPADLLTELSRLDGGTADLRITNTGQTQAIHPWMELAASSFTLRGNEGEGARAAVLLTAITIGETTLNYGTTDIDLQAAAITLTAATTLTGGAISLTGAINVSTSNNNDLTITAMGVLTLNDNINLGTGDLVINAMGGTTLGGGVVLTADEITLTGDITSASNALTITAATSLALNSDINAGTGNLTLNVGSTGGTFTGVRMLSGNVVTIGGTEGILADGDLTISALGDLMVNAGGINLGAGANTLQLEAGRAPGTSAGQTGIITFMLPNIGFLRAANFVLVQDGAVFPAMRPAFFRDSDGVIPTTGNPSAIRLFYDGAGTQTEVDWAVRFVNTVSRGDGGTFEVAASDLSGGLLGALVSITLDAGAGVLTFAGTDDITLTAPTITITAGNINTSGRNLTITTDGGTLTLNITGITAGTGNLSLTSGTILIGRAVSTPANTRIVLRGQDVTLTAADGILLGRFTGREIFRSNSDVANLTVRADGTLTIAADITVDSTARSGGDIRFVGSNADSPIAFTGARTITGRAITLRSEATGTASLTLTASGTLTIENDITLTGAGLTLALSGAGAIARTGRPRLTADMVSLAQVDAFPVTRTLRVIPGSSLAITTEAAQDVHDWMIRENIGLTVTSSNRVRVVAIIGTGGVAGRNLGTGALSLTSTGGAVRILANITTTGSITLIGGTGGINFNSGAGAKTLSGGTVTLNGNARSDRDLTLNATNSGGALTISGEIVLTGTSALELSGGGGITLDGALTLTGGAITLNDAAVGIANLTITADTLTFSGGIVLGSGGIIDLRSRQGAITGTGTLFATTVRLRQVDVFGITPPPFNFGATGSLELTTTVNQDVHDWMIASGRNLTVTSAANVVVRSAIGSGNRNLGTGSLTLESTEGVVRIFAGISTTGNITLSGGTGGINLNGGAAKTLAGAIITLTGDARSNRDLALDASGTLTLNNDINIGTSALTLTSGVGAIVATGRPRLTAGMVSFSQVDALPVTRPFRFIPSSSLAITTEAAQDVHDWMILENINLTVTSSNRVRVVAIIGTGGVAGRNLGTGALSLTSTGGAVRILANISISNNITLSGGTGGINLNGTDTLSGAIITLTGDARGNRDLTITASGVLTINNNINIGTGTLTLTGASFVIDTNVDLAAGSHSFSDGRTCDGSTMPSCTVNTP